MSLLIKYRSSVTASYTLNAFCPIEGLNVTISGDGGRIEYMERKASHVLDSNGKPEIDPSGYRMAVRVIPLFSHGYDVPIDVREGGHGGSDILVQEQIFSANPQPEHLGRNAGHEQGAASLLIGAAANRSIKTGLPVDIDDLLPLNPCARQFSELI